MNQTFISISWDAFSNNVCKGFSSLQQNAEFVDMTLAADGHLVKVHKNVIALASPYLKAMLQSAPCQNPVVFLNNVSHKILGYLLEYIYTGEVKIPANVLDKFIEICNSLSIRGVESIAAPKITVEKQLEPHIERIEQPPEDNFAAHITINNQESNYNLELISEENKSISQNVNEFINNNEPRNSEMDDTHNNKVDISSIQDFIIIKPNITSNETELDRNDKRNSIQILSDETIVPKDSAINSLVMKLNNNATESAVNIPVDGNNWQLASANLSQNPSVIQIDLSANSIWPQATLTQNNNDCLSNASQSISDIQTDSMESTNIPTLLVNKRQVKKRPNKIIKFIKDIKPTNNSDKITLNNLNKGKMGNVAHYTISNRGSLQILMNRYMYHSHHHSKGGRKRRWRCIDYRKMHCPAYIDTDNEEIIATSENHCHPNHDNQIKKKIKSNIVFTSLSTTIHALNNYLKENPKK